jgi:hypothetical protein
MWGMLQCGRILLVRVRFIVGIVVCLISNVVYGAAGGQFEGDVVVSWVNGSTDRDMKLVQPFIFIDPSGKRWTAPAGTVINGASIPQPLWSLHDPFIGPYRRASVVHDYYCTPPYTEPDHQVHRMFYEAALAAGTRETLAWAMWKAIEAGGPHWKDVEIRVVTGPQTGPTIESAPSAVVRTEQRPWTPDVSAQELQALFQRAQDPEADRAAIEAEVAKLGSRNQPPSLVTLPPGANQQ